MRSLSILAFLISVEAFACTENYDLLIRGGRVVDGTGSPACFADVAVKDGRIVAIGKPAGEATTTLEARGLIVAPGFIDVHTHAENIEDLPLGENFLRMGVTTLVLGNCGGSALNVGEFFKKLEDTRISPNIATLIGHNTVRSHVMGGAFNRQPTSEELTRMKELVERAMKDGALGLSTGLIYLPGTFAKTDEIIELSKVASTNDGMYVSHMRDEGLDILESLNELFQIAREARLRAHVSHIKLSGKPAWGRARKIIEAIEKARADGLDITQDQYVYTASSTGISQLIPEAAREGGKEKFLERIHDPAQKAEIVREMKAKLKRGQRESYEYAVIADYDKDTSLNGKNVVEAAKLKHGSDSLDDQIELILEIQSNGGAGGVFFGIDENDLRLFMQHPNTIFASDSGVRKFQDGVPHPRGYGNNTRVLANYVRELKLLRLEEAIRRMTSLPATTFRIQDRGQVREGNWADLVLFNPTTVQDSATFSDPHHYATGFAAVIVNGVIVVKDDAHTRARPGMIVRRKSAEAR